MESELLVDKDNNIIDPKQMPSIELSGKLYELLELEGIEEYRKNLNTYYFNNVPVPRVSMIFKECIGKEFLINWAAKLGYKDYIRAKEEATTIGSRVHDMIEHYLLTGEDLDLSYKISPSYLPSINQAYKNFKDWYFNFQKSGYVIEKIIAVEKVVVCPFYGGTIDLIAVINGDVYIIDFKTSKSISVDYIMQVCAYAWEVNNGYAPGIPHINGIGIIRVDKFKDKFEDYFLTERVPYQREILYRFTCGFGSLLSSYYHQINMKYLFGSYKRQYDIRKVLGDTKDE